MYSAFRFGVRFMVRTLRQAFAPHRCLANLSQLNALRVIMVSMLIPGSNVLRKLFPSFTRFPTFSSTTYLQLAWLPRRRCNVLQHFSSSLWWFSRNPWKYYFFMVRPLKGSIPQLDTCISGSVHCSHAKNVVNIRWNKYIYHAKVFPRVKERKDAQLRNPEFSIFMPQHIPYINCDKILSNNRHKLGLENCKIFTRQRR